MHAIELIDTRFFSRGVLTLSILCRVMESNSMSDNADGSEEGQVDDDDIDVLDIEKPRTGSQNESSIGMNNEDEEKQLKSSGALDVSDDDDGIKVIEEVKKGGTVNDDKKNGIGDKNSEETDDDDDEKNMPTIRLNTGIFDADDDEEDEQDVN